MARISDVTTSDPDHDRDTSPDPITMPSSPILAHSGNRKSSIRPSPRRTTGPRGRSATPSKSLVLDTPKDGVASPWRIKVTVQAEPHEGSPAKRMTRTTTVALNDSPSRKRRSSSPSKKASASKRDGADAKKPARKRKGTPVRGGRPRARPPVEPEPQPEPEQQVDVEMEPAPTIEDHLMPPPSLSHSSARRASGRLSRLSTQDNSTYAKRLSVAREELDEALEEAIGFGHTRPRCDVPGDKTVSLNEDFSIISIDSLQNAKEASMHQSVQSVREGGQSAASISHLPSSPPKAKYPEIASKAVEARTSLGQGAMNGATFRISTGSRDLHSSASARSKGKQRSSDQAQSVFTLQRTTNATGSLGVIDDEHTVSEASEMVDEAVEEDVPSENADIWQEEASRQLMAQEEAGIPDGSRQDSVHAASRSPQLQDLFAGQPVKPLRSKIPRTWRRSSGIEFSYVDSPANAQEAPLQPQTYSHDLAGERRHSTDGSGVLTPPSTDGDGEGSENADNMEKDDDLESEFQPDAEATRYQDPDAMVVDEGMSEGNAGDLDSDSESDAEDRDTGQFFTSNMPAVYNQPRPRKRPPQRKTMDLTELLNLDGAPSPGKGQVADRESATGTDRDIRDDTLSKRHRYSPLRMRPVLGRVSSSPRNQGNYRLLDSPLRKSLLRSSKMHGSSPQRLSEKKAAQAALPQEQAFNTDNRPSAHDSPQSEIDNSFESKTSDQQQLLSEASMHEQHKSPRSQRHARARQQDFLDAGLEENIPDDQRGERQSIGQTAQRYTHEQEEMDYEEDFYEEQINEPSKSYEERLNLDSPTKIKVNFNDSRSNSTLLAPRKQYQPLFDQSSSINSFAPNSINDPRGTVTFVDKDINLTSESQPGLLSRLTSTFWSAVVRPTGPPEILPKPQLEESIVFSADLRAQLRSRYGVVCEDFPWTMHHMRVLHRMLNSAESGRDDTLIPRSGPLPTVLARKAETWQTSVTGWRWLFTTTQAYVACAFLSVLVPKATVDAMRRAEVEWLGDGLAGKCREWYGGRHGSWPVFTPEVHGRAVADKVDGMKGTIGVEFVVAALGSAVGSNVDLELSGKEAKEFDND